MTYVILLLYCNIVIFSLQEVLEGREGPILPAARVFPTNGELFWLVDDPAAASLTIQVERLGSGVKLWSFLFTTSWQEVTTGVKA